MPGTRRVAVCLLVLSLMLASAALAQTVTFGAQTSPRAFYSISEVPSDTATVYLLGGPQYTTFINRADAALCMSGAAVFAPEKRTQEKAKDGANGTEVVTRALTAKLLLRTVTGTLRVDRDGDRVVRARIEAEAEEEYRFLASEEYRGGIGETRIRTCSTTFVIPAGAGHFNLVQPYMDGKRVEAQFLLDKPGGEAVANLRFIGVLKGQQVTLPEVRPAPPGKPRAPGGATRFVAPTGNDRGPGTQEQPFQTIRKGICVLKPGDTLILRGGRYHEAPEISKLNGTEDRPITISAYEGEEVLLDGSEALDAVAAGPWAKGENGLWQRRLTKPVWQLWMDGKMLTLARWPNVTKNWTEPMAPPFNGRLPEPGTAWDEASYFARFDPSEARGNFSAAGLKHFKAPDGTFAPSPFDSAENVKKLAVRSLSPLGRTGSSLAGAVVEGLSPSPAVITHHEAGSDRFEVVFDHFDKRLSSALVRGRFVIRGHVNCIDVPEEWAFDPHSSTLYVKLADGAKPEDHLYRVRTADVAARISDSRHITIRNLRFHACRLVALNSPGTVVEGCVFSYPTYRRTVMVAYEMKEHAAAGAPARTFEDKFLDAALILHPGGTLRDCEVRYYQSRGIEIQGVPALVENCCFHHGEGGAINFARSPGAVARRNTIHSTLENGAIYIRKTPEGRFIAELNYGYDFGTWRSDASGVQVQSGSQNFQVTRGNWFHHSECKALRFDGQPAGSLGTAVGNVGWHLWQGMQVKGDYQKAFNNTMIECGKRHDISVINQMAFGSGQHSVTRNNLADRLSGHRTNEDLRGAGRIPGFHSHNWNGLVTGRRARDRLRDADNFDFRPRNLPEIVDAGTTLVDDRFVSGSWLDNLRFAPFEGRAAGQAPIDVAVSQSDPKNTFTRVYLGKAPDIGAYEYGDRHYRIPGRQLREASFPIPPDNAQYVKTDADLMWLEGKAAVEHHVFLGTNRDTVTKADRKTPEYVGRFTDSNTCTPPKRLSKDVRYYWRVDTIEADGTVLKGPVWAFLPCDGRYEQYRPIAGPEKVRARVQGGNTVILTWGAVNDKRLAGYNVYRRWGNPEYVRIAGTKLNAAPLTTPSFADTTLDSKGRFYYVVEAVDHKGVASEESSAVRIEVK